MEITYSLFWVTLAIGSVCVSAYTAMELNKTAQSARAGQTRYMWLTAAALCLGVGIWGMHFIGMAAMKTSSQFVHSTPAMAFSIAPAIIASGLSYFYAEISRGKTNHYYVPGLILATGIVGMHFVGMAGLHAPGYRIEHNLAAVLIGVGIGVGSAITGLNLGGHKETKTQSLGALMIGLGIAAVHFVDQLALRFVPDNTIIQYDFSQNSHEAESQIAIGAVLLICFLSTLFTTLAVNARQFSRLRNTTSDSLRHSQKMEALGQLTGGIAHDFNNLLMIIQGSMDLLLKDPTHQRAAKLRESIFEAVMRGQGLTRQLLAFARRQSLDPKCLNITEHFRTNGELWRRPLPPNIDLSIAPSHDLWTIDADVDAFGVAILNLVVNARDAMPEGGELIVNAMNRKIAPGSKLSIQLGISGDFVEIDVRDTGVGMSNDVREHIFEPFFTTKEVGKGTGLGLAQVWGFVNQSNGHILVESIPDEGTKFRLFFPRGKTVPVALEAPMEITHTCPFKTVLLVEDDVHVARVTRAMLQELGCEVWWAASGTAALEIIEKNAPELLFSDIILPGGMSGVELSRKVRESHPDIKIMLATGYTPESDGRAAIEFPVLRKPYLEQDLIKALHEVK